MPLLYLPNEILVHIGKYLDFRDVRACRCSCRLLNALFVDRNLYKCLPTGFVLMDHHKHMCSTLTRNIKRARERGLERGGIIFQKCYVQPVHDKYIMRAIACALLSPILVFANYWEVLCTIRSLRMIFGRSISYKILEKSSINQKEITGQLLKYSIVFIMEHTIEVAEREARKNGSDPINIRVHNVCCARYPKNWEQNISDGVIHSPDGIISFHVRKQNGKLPIVLCGPYNNDRDGYNMLIDKSSTEYKRDIYYSSMAYIESPANSFAPIIVDHSSPLQALTVKCKNVIERVVAVMAGFYSSYTLFAEHVHVDLNFAKFELTMVITNILKQIWKECKGFVMVMDDHLLKGIIARDEDYLLGDVLTTLEEDLGIKVFVNGISMHKKAPLSYDFDTIRAMPFRTAEKFIMRINRDSGTHDKNNMEIISSSSVCYCPSISTRDIVYLTCKYKPWKNVPNSIKLNGIDRLPLLNQSSLRTLTCRKIHIVNIGCLNTIVFIDEGLIRKYTIEMMKDESGSHIFPEESFKKVWERFGTSATYKPETKVSEEK